MQDFFSLDTLKQIFCYPWLELKNDLKAIFIQNRHRTKSSIRVVSILLAITAGTCGFFYSPKLFDFITGITKTLTFIPDVLQTTLAAGCIINASSSLGAYLSKECIRLFCKFKFGDPDFYLTKTRLNQLIQEFKDQGINIEASLIKDVVAFCIKNLRDRHSADIGTSKHAWQQILNSLIYDADLDLFLEQQMALQAKRKLILDKQAAIDAYIKFNLEQSVQTHTLQSQLEDAMSFMPTFRAKSPLLSSAQTSNPEHLDESNGSTTSTLNSAELALAEKVLAKFRHRHKKLLEQAEITESQLIAKCVQHLEHKSFHAGQSIHPEIERITNQFALRQASFGSSPLESPLIAASFGSHGGSGTAASLRFQGT